MPVTLADLCKQQALNVRFHGRQEQLEREIKWVATTGLLDPTPWLGGGELVMTNSLWLKTEEQQVALVRAMAKAGVAGIGFAASPDRSDVPQYALREALELGLPAIESPASLPYVALVRFVAERLIGEESERRQRLLEAHSILSGALLSGDGLGSLLTALSRLIEAPAAVIDVHGRVLGSYPRNHKWPVAEMTALARAKEPRPVDEPGPEARLIELDGYPIALLCSGATSSTDVLAYALNLVGLELAKRQAVQAERRELTGQVIDDILNNVISDKEAARRLSDFGVQLSEPHAVILATADCEPSRLQSLPWALGPTMEGSERERSLTAVVGRYVFVLVPRSKGVQEQADEVFSILSDLVRGVAVGFGGSYADADGLRWSFIEAQAGVAQGHGVNGRASLDLAKMLLSNPQLPLRQMATEILSPILAPTENGELLATLRAYFLNNESTSDMANTLYIHRNTVRYRLRRVEQLTGKSLASTQDRLQLWLAVLALDLGAN
jgi:purine catabolism regulator